MTDRADHVRHELPPPHRELFVSPSGGLVIDIPGMRVLGVLENKKDLRAAFGDIDEIAAQCRFSD